MLLGSQVPRIRSVPDYVATSGHEVADLAAQAGLILDVWQRNVLVDAMGEQRNGLWAARDVGLVVGRQNGKNSILEARELGGLFLLGEQTIIHTAHQYKTAHESFLRVRSLIDNNDSFRKRVKSITASPGSAEIKMMTGQRLMFVARGVNGSVRGFSPDVVMMDEAYRLPADVQSAITPAISVRPNPQLWYTSSAGFGSSDTLRRLRERGMSNKSTTLAYFEWSVAEGADRTDPRTWAEANPAYNIRLYDAAIISELESMEPADFDRERLGIWEADTESAGLPYEQWLALADPLAERGAAPVFGVATSPDHTWSAVAVAWRRSDGRTQVMLVDYRKGTEWLRDTVSALRNKWSAPVCVDQASRGLVDGQVIQLTTDDQAKAHNSLGDAILTGDVRHGNEPAMNLSVKGAKWRPMSDTRVLDRKGTLDITPIVAAADAVYGVTLEPPSIYEERPMLVLG